MQYKIQWIELKPTATGKVRKIASISDEQNHVFDNVTFWGNSWTNFDALAPGMTVEGDYKEEGKFRTLFQAKTYNAVAQGSRPTGIKAAQERKEATINNSMDRKENSIVLSGSQRDAVLIVTTFYANQTLTEAEIGSKIIKWRNWLIENHGNDKDITETTQPF